MLLICLVNQRLNTKVSVLNYCFSQEKVVFQNTLKIKLTHSKLQQIFVSFPDKMILVLLYAPFGADLRNKSLSMRLNANSSSSLSKTRGINGILPKPSII